MTVKTFQKKILRWYEKNRRDLSFRNTRNPYRILVSELMLQQTQISRVLPKYKEFLKAFPTLRALASAPQSALLKTWQGLGYWRRAKFLQECARKILKEFGGKFPKEPKTLEALPGVGHYTARAIVCFAFQHPEAFLDTNIRRVYLHFFFSDRSGVTDKEILPIAQKAVDELRRRPPEADFGATSPREWHYALFDYGAIVLKDKTINRQSRHYHKQSRFTGSLRSFRARVVELLLDEPNHRIPKAKLFSWLTKEIQKQNRPYSASQILDSLLKDNLVKTVGVYIAI